MDQRLSCSIRDLRLQWTLLSHFSLHWSIVPLPRIPMITRCCPVRNLYLSRNLQRSLASPSQLYVCDRLNYMKVKQLLFKLNVEVTTEL